MNLGNVTVDGVELAFGDEVAGGQGSDHEHGEVVASSRRAGVRVRWASGQETTQSGTLLWLAEDCRHADCVTA